MSYAIPQIEEVQAASGISQSANSQSMANNFSSNRSSSSGLSGSVSHIDIDSIYNKKFSGAESGPMNNSTSNQGDSLQKISESSHDLQSSIENNSNRMRASSMYMAWEKTRSKVLQGYLSAHMNSVGKIGQLTQSINSI